MMRITKSLRIGVGLLLLMAVGEQGAVTQPGLLYAYVPNAADGTISAIDLSKMASGPMPSGRSRPPFMPLTSLRAKFWGQRRRASAPTALPSHVMAKRFGRLIAPAASPC